MITRSNAILPLAHTGALEDAEGLFCLADGTVAGADAEAFGVVTEVIPNGGDASVAICAGGLSGTVSVKLSTVAVVGDLVGSDADGAATTAATVVCAQVLEAGEAGDQVEASIFKAVLA